MFFAALLKTCFTFSPFEVLPETPSILQAVGIQVGRDT